VHLAARVMGEAGDGEILVTSAVAQTTAGTDLAFVARGATTLKGLDEPWELFVLVG
jgi:class 3 adenylate cyclase